MDDRAAYFEQMIWPHSRAAYSLARWMARNDHDAEDILQESLIKALRSANNIRGTDARPWLLAIVRNTALTFLSRRKPAMETEWTEGAERKPDRASDPERSLMERSRRDRVRTAIASLPPEFREALVLRELEDLSYKEIGFVLKIPMGTVMSRISRARALLARDLLTGGKP